jgi:hypothetical protein
MYRRIAGLAGLAVAVLVIVQGAGAGAGEKTGGKPKAKKGNYVHTVIFYLKKDAPKNAAKTIVQDSHKLLRKIPTVRGLWVGPPAAKEQSTPEVSVSDYQVGLLVLFDDSDGLKGYLEHPLHDEFVKRHRKHIERVVVYDFLNQKAKK